MLERSIKVLFSTHDLSRVKHYVTRQLHKLLEGKVSVIDLIFAKEYRGMMGYKPGACIPSLEIARLEARGYLWMSNLEHSHLTFVSCHDKPSLETWWHFMRFLLCFFFLEALKKKFTAAMMNAWNLIYPTTRGNLKLLYSFFKLSNKAAIQLHKIKPRFVCSIWPR